MGRFDAQIQDVPVLSSDEAAKQDAMAVYKRLLRYAMAYWKYLGLAMVGMVIYAATDSGFAFMMKPLLDGAFVERDTDAVRWVPFFIVGLFLVRGFAGFLSDVYMSLVSRHVIANLRRETFAQLLHLPSAYYDQSSAGIMLSKLTYNIEQVADSTTKAMTVFVRDTLTIVGLLGVMLYFSARLTIFIFVTAPIIWFLIRRLGSFFRRYNTGIQESMGDVTKVAEQVLSAQRVIKIFNGQEHELKAFSRVNEENRRLNMKLVFARAGGEPLIMLIAALAVAGIVYVATMDSAQISPGSFVAFFNAVLLIMAPLKRLTNINASIQRGIAAGTSIFALLDEEIEPKGGDLQVPRVNGDVQFDQVAFAYSRNKGQVLRGISLKIPAGQTCAFVGRSGSGKSTLVSLLPRFYEIQSGAIRVDGHDIKDFSLGNLRDQISLVSQDVTLFNDSIANNIAYGGLEGTSIEQVREAAAAAHVLEFTDQLPDGLDTMVGDRGVLLSGGQRQRIAIARALLKDAPILILDEATSALDTEAERHIKRALDRLMRNRTTLVIAHRLSTVESADCIVVLHQGQVVESGTHEQLLASEGHYATLYRMQFSENQMSDPDAPPTSGSDNNHHGDDSDKPAGPTQDVLVSG